ncbi:SusC/RagA family TonB-linked outer membrane protein [Paraflavisolibacter sp. H34]|uniref:SusC/RagA family TonB-linked outer membrane protein n=1 Tax=Huijunlia imazamoxiresistens TaxID=3127457 RepID=UPI00301A962A
MMLMLLCTLAYGQTRTITGTVRDENGNPVPFATVTETGTKNAATADASGNFSISVKQNSRITISSAGFQGQTITPTGNTIELTLSKGGQLQEVVVTALGIRRSEKALGYSVSKVDPNAITQKSEPDVLKTLQGKVAGVDIRSGQGTPGAATRIQIRGNSSFFGNNQPLIIVDGVPYSNDQVSTSNQTSGGGAYSSGLSNLDPNDIASMNVLKGSSAAALYGSRASNGVIVITTKSGSAARSKKGLEVNLRSSFSVEKIANLPIYQNDFGAGSLGSYSGSSNGSWGPAFRDRDSIPVWDTYKAAYPELFPSANIPYRAYPNNVKDLFNNGTVYENSIGVTGGDDKNSVALTASQLTHNGYVPNSSYKRANIGMGGATKLSFGLNVRGNFSYSRSVQRGGFFGENQISGAASQFARSLFLARNWDVSLPFEDKAQNSLTWNGGGQFDHPLWSAKYNRINTDEERFVAGFHADYNFTKWARVDYTLGSNVHLLGRREITELGSRAAEAKGRLVLEDYRKQEIESNLLFTFTPSVGEDFTLRATVGQNVNQRTITDQVNTGNRFITRGIYTLKNTEQQIFTDDYYQRRRIWGLLGDVNFGYKDVAFLQVTGRNDWSSTLPEANRSYFYPSVSGSFVFADALGLTSDLFNFGKLRAGWARVGRDADPYYLQDIYRINPNFRGQPTASRPSQANNANLKPEFTREVELGTQLSFLKRRVDLDFTWYHRTSTNLIAPIGTPPSSGFQSLIENFGEITNKGVEVDLTLHPVKTQNFSWDLRGIFTRNRNTVEKLTEGVERISLDNVIEDISPYLEAGKPFGYLRGFKSLRDEEGNLLINPATGGMIQANEQEMIGDPNPDWKLGITNTLSYKGFFVNALWDMTKGGDIYSVTISSLLGRGVSKDTRDRETSWIIPGVYADPNTGQPILDGGKKIPNQTRITTNDLYFSPNATTGQTFAINTANEWNVYDATVYRLREVSLGYDLPKSLFRKLPIGSASLTLTGRNLWYLAPNVPKYTRFDPEVNSFGNTSTQGIELSTAPTTRRMGINLNVTF